MTIHIFLKSIRGLAQYMKSKVKPPSRFTSIATYRLDAQHERDRVDKKSASSFKSLSKAFNGIPLSLWQTGGGIKQCTSYWGPLQLKTGTKAKAYIHE